MGFSINLFFGFGGEVPLFVFVFFLMLLDTLCCLRIKYHICYYFFSSKNKEKDITY